MADVRRVTIMLLAFLLRKFFHNQNERQGNHLDSKRYHDYDKVDKI